MQWLTRIIAVAALVVPAAPTPAAVFQQVPTDDIWVTFMAGNPVGDPLLRVWHNSDEPYPSPNYPANAIDFYCAYSYLKWDLSSIPTGEYELQSAKLTLRHEPAKWTPAQAQNHPLEARALAPEFSEYTWDYWDTSNPAPGPVYGEANLDNYSTTAYFDIVIDLLGGSSLGRTEADFAAAVYDAINTQTSLAVACTSSKTADMSGGQPYKFASKDNGGQAGPTLRLEYALKNLSISDVKKSLIPFGGLVRIENKVVSATFETASDTVYVCEPGRQIGIGVKLNGKASGLVPGDIVTIEGTTVLWDGTELGIEATSITKTASGNAPKPLFLNNRHTGGSGFGKQPGVAGANGLNNIGTLVRVAGQVTATHPSFSLPWQTNAHVFWIDDGSGVFDSLADGSGAQPKGIAVVAPSEMAFPPSGFKAVTGVARCISGPNGPARIIVATSVDQP